MRKAVQKPEYAPLLAEVVAASANNLVFREGRWHFGENAQRTLHHVAGGHFYAIGEAIAVADAQLPQ